MDGAIYQEDLTVVQHWIKPSTLELYTITVKVMIFRNFAFCNSYQVKEVHIMLDLLKQLGLFFKYSPKPSKKGLNSAKGNVNKTEHKRNVSLIYVKWDKFIYYIFQNC